MDDAHKYHTWLSQALDRSDLSDEQRSAVIEAATWVPSTTEQRPSQPPGTPASGAAPLDPFATSGSPPPGAADPPEVASPLHNDAPRYEPLERIGLGGMSEVWRAWDRALDRAAALKILRWERRAEPTTLRRFSAEASITARLQHPGIPPVYDVGLLADGRQFFVMKEIAGVTLGELIRAHHELDDAPRPEAVGWSRWRLMETFLKVCEAMAYAHRQHYMHRDLKPENIMIGAFGEVLVVDWGIAKHLRDGGEEAFARVPASASRLDGDAAVTQAGALIGTPAYMPPESVLDPDYAATPQTDVYALGAILYEILTGEAPHVGRTPAAILVSVASGPPPSLPGSIPAELAAICQRAMARELGERYPSTLELAVDIQAWMEQARRRGQALEILEQVDALNPTRDQGSLHRRAAALREQARSLLRVVRPWEPVEKKLPAWTLLDEARSLEAEAELNEVRYVQGLQSALSLMPDLAEAHQRLADYHLGKHRDAERRNDAAAAARHALMLEAHDQGRYRVYLEGKGRLSVVTDPPGASVSLYGWEERQRRKVPVLLERLGRTPLKEVSLKGGSYLLRLEAPGRVPVDYPVEIARGEHWDGVRPGDAAPLPIYLPLKSELSHGEVYVPAGWTWVGGDEIAAGALTAERVWVDPFVIERHPITNAGYLAFLNDLVSRGNEEVALRHVPRAGSAHPDERGPMAYGRGADGLFHLTVDAEGDMWQPDWPVMLVRWFDAVAYARWLAETTELPWRLPQELEWEKAARGVDRRIFPWGNYCDPTWCCMLESHPQRPMIASVDAFEHDESPYGVRGMAGNVRDWCLDRYQAGRPPTSPCVGPPDTSPGLESDPRIIRGGYFGASEPGVHCAGRNWNVPAARGVTTGFRVLRPISSATRSSME